MDDLVYLTATQLAEAIRSRRISATEVLDAHLKRIAQHNPQLKAIVTTDEEAARQRAKQADKSLVRGEWWGPLHGVPVTIKDTFETRGMRTTSSYRPLANYIPERDATVVARLRAAGAIVLGKTNLPELARDCQTISPIFGRASNPWDLNRTPGGSTGGGAAAVAAGLSPLELGSDIGGSIRIPAHFCGVYGLKPSEYRVPGTGHIPDLPGDPRAIWHMNTYGPLARSIGDLRLALTLIAGPDDQDWTVPPAPLTEPPPCKLHERCFAWTDDFGNVPVTIETRAAIEKLANTLAELGCRVERRKPPGLDFEAAWHTYGEILGTETAVSIPLPLRTLGYVLNPMVYRNEPIHYGMSQGIGLSMERYMKALTRREAVIGVMDSFLSEWDAWLCPVSSTPAFTHRRSAIYAPGQPIEVDDQRVPYWIGSISHTSLFNLTGNPVVVIPLARSKEGLPIGVQIVGRRWGEMELLAIAEQLAEVIGPFEPPRLAATPD